MMMKPVTDKYLQKGKILIVVAAIITLINLSVNSNWSWILFCLTILSILLSGHYLCKSKKLLKQSSSQREKYLKKQFLFFIISAIFVDLLIYITNYQNSRAHFIPILTYSGILILFGSVFLFYHYKKGGH